MREKQVAKKEKQNQRPEEQQIIRRRSLATRIRNYFFAGMLVVAPIGITFWLVWQFVTFIDDQVTPLIPYRWNPSTYLPVSVPGIGVVVAAILITLIGFLTAGFLGRLITTYADRLVNRLPLLGSIYSWTKQLFETVFSQKSAAFREVVLVEYPCRGIWAIGFLTGKTVGEVQSLTDDVVYNVFVPATPNVTTGFLLFIPGRDIVHLKMSVEAGLKLVISGGIVEPKMVAPKFMDGYRERLEKEYEEKARIEQEAGKIADTPGSPAPVRFLRRLRNYFFAGILVVAPIGITIWLGWKIITYLDNKILPLFPAAWHPETYLPFSVPGLGVILMVLVLSTVGFLTAGIFGRSLVLMGERVVNTMPIVGGLYSGLKQLFETILKEQSRAFREVVLVEYPRKESWAIAFVTVESEGEIQDKTEEDVLGVFLPTTPNPTSGFLLYVPKTEMTKLKLSVEDGLKMVISGGIVTPEGESEKADEGEKEGQVKPDDAQEKLA